MSRKTDHPAFIDAFLQPGFYPHTVMHCTLIETHISWVILTGKFAYKIKKPVNFGFLDFSTLEKRKFYCEEELRLNRRLAADIYLDVVTIAGSHDKPVLGGEKNIFDYAVKMKQFPPQIELDHLLEQGKLNHHIIDAIAYHIADFHQHISIADSQSNYGLPEIVIKPIRENFQQVREKITDQASLEMLGKIESWSESTFKQLESILIKRKKQGFIRECHGDLHLRNLAWYKEKPLAFDCLEFNPAFRWIDVMSEIAFLIMDLTDHKQAKLGQRFLNQYLEYTGDYAGCILLKFYLAYRAMVRAKVEAIRAHQPGISTSESKAALSAFSNYLALAFDYTKPVKPFILITHGVSASGKSTISAPLAEILGAIRIRSDIERKRLFSVPVNQHSHNEIDQGLYSRKATEQTYLKLVELAENIIIAGYPVIIDASFPTLSERQLFQKLAEKYQLSFTILELFADTEKLKQRIVARQDDVSDADLSVLLKQLENWHPLDEKERELTCRIHTNTPVDINALAKQLSLQIKSTKSV